MKNFSFSNKRPLIISGPCSAESEEQTLQTARELAATGVVDVFRAGIWKPRTNPGSFEGVGVKGLPWLMKVKEETGMPVAIEVATAKHVENALEFGVDILWLGARTTVNPFSVQEIADALRGSNVPVLIKNPMNPDIDLWAGAVRRLEKVGVDIANIALIHRGFSYFGSNDYRNNPMWHLALEMRSRFPEMKLICDPSHICGNRENLQKVSQQAADLMFDGLIIESHIDPAQAWSDASQQLTPTDLGQLVNSVKWRETTVDNPEFVNKLDGFRSEIDQIDSEIFDLLSRRMKVADKIGEVKRDNNVAILQGSRWSSIVNTVIDRYTGMGLGEDFLKTVLEAIHVESITHQNAVMNKK